MIRDLNWHSRASFWQAPFAVSLALASLVACSGTGAGSTPPGSFGGTGTPLGNAGTIGSLGGNGSSSGGASGRASSSNGGTAGTGPAPGTCTALNPIQRRLWRLSVDQFQNSLKDVLQLPTTPQLTSRGGEAQWAFFSDVALEVDDSLQFALYQLMESVLPTIPASVTACKSGEAPAACATRIATDIGAKAFRRPLRPEEIAALVSNAAKPATGTAGAVSAAPFVVAGSDTQLGIKLMLEAIFLSPSFAYRTELGPSTLQADASGKFPDTVLTPYEVAAQLGLTFLGSAPDAALEAAAADTSDQGLGSMTGIKAQVDRLLTLPSVRQNLTTIVAGWFNIGQLFLKTHDSSFLSGVSAADQGNQTGIQSDLYTAAQLLISDTLWTNPGKIGDLLNTPRGFFNTRLAALYPEVTFPNGRPTSLTTFVPGVWPTSENRVGLLTDPSYFWAQSDPAANSIVKRGKAFHDDILCADPLPPPVDLGSPLALAVIAQGDSEVTKSDARLATSPCNACHQQMDAYSRVLQHFGPIGNYRALDEAGRAIDTSFTYQAPSPFAPQTIAGPKELAQALISSGKLSGCAVQKMASYLIGSMIQKYDTCEIGTIRAEFDKTDGTLSSLFRTVVVADFARARSGGMK